MTNIPARTMDFFNRQVVCQIVEKYGVNEMAAVRRFIESETYQMLSDSELEIYKMSPRIVFDMWEIKKTTAPKVLKQWDSLNLTDFIYDLYEIYHSERLQNAFDDIDQMILEKQSILKPNDSFENN